MLLRSGTPQRGSMSGGQLLARLAQGAVAGRGASLAASPSGRATGSRAAAGGSRGSSLGALLRGCPTSEAGVGSCERSGRREGLICLLPDRALLLDAIGRPRAPLRAEVFAKQAPRRSAGPTGAGTSAMERPEAGKRPNGSRLWRGL